MKTRPWVTNPVPLPQRGSPTEAKIGFPQAFLGDDNFLPSSPWRKGRRPIWPALPFSSSAPTECPGALPSGRLSWCQQSCQIPVSPRAVSMQNLTTAPCRAPMVAGYLLGGT
jgi:hypothetical protein